MRLVAAAVLLFGSVLVAGEATPATGAAETMPPCTTEELATISTANPRAAVDADFERLATVVNGADGSVIGYYLTQNAVPEVHIVGSLDYAFATSLISALDESQLPFAVYIDRGCVRLSDLMLAKEQIEKMCEYYPLAMSLDAHTQTVLIRVTSHDMARELSSRFGSLVTTVVTDMARASRDADDAPHYGGAKITRPDTGNCTSGLQGAPYSDRRQWNTDRRPLRAPGN